MAVVSEWCMLSDDQCGCSLSYMMGLVHQACDAGLSVGVFSDEVSGMRIHSPFGRDGFAFRPRRCQGVPRKTSNVCGKCTS